MFYRINLLLLAKVQNRIEGLVPYECLNCLQLKLKSNHMECTYIFGVYIYHYHNHYNHYYIIIITIIFSTSRKRFLYRNFSNILSLFPFLYTSTVSLILIFQKPEQLFIIMKYFRCSSIWNKLLIPFLKVLLVNSLVGS